MARSWHKPTNMGALRKGTHCEYHAISAHTHCQLHASSSFSSRSRARSCGIISRPCSDCRLETKRGARNGATVRCWLAAFTPRKLPSFRGGSHPKKYCRFQNFESRNRRPGEASPRSSLLWSPMHASSFGACISFILDDSAPATPRNGDLGPSPRAELTS